MGEPELKSWAMRRCFDLAGRSRAYTHTNPMVGAVLLDSTGKVKTEGYHHGFGKAHAEVDAITKKSVIISSEDRFFVSLEPCVHHGKTPPCAEFLLRQNFKQCIISTLDPNPLVNGRGVRILQDGGKVVETSVEEHIGKELIRVFTVQQDLKRPYIILKWAQSIDGYLGTSGIRTKLSDPITDRLVHKWRSEAQAILVGSGTIMTDLPLLDNRLYYGPSPMRITIDRELKIPDDNPFFRRYGKAIRYSYHGKLPANDCIEEVQLSTEGGPLLHQVIRSLYDRQIGSLLVEGGAKLLEEFLSYGLWDECRIITSPKVLEHGVKASVPPEGVSNKLNFGKDQILVIHPGDPVPGEVKEC